MNNRAHPQDGVVLVTSLIMLVVMTLLVISLVRTSVIELKIGGANQVAAQNLANAEASIWAFMNANQGKFAHNATFHPVGGQVDFSGDYSPSVAKYAYLKSDRLIMTVTEVGCGPDAARGSGHDPTTAPHAVLFDVRAEARDVVFGGRSVVHQGVRSILPPGSCP
ncbi:pilus assembly PilX N-terminal domain-containing protein [Accumulibacter sp.]|uniref:pilus assembly PilX family protein n=1 Tax=Accumulibacter sp. TaxID=2053492 RepID=UPI00261B1593|nr:pilus assembly PilX N-terminal domain-containing protein [Accumulibacter sp.]